METGSFVQASRIATMAMLTIDGNLGSPANIANLIFAEMSAPRIRTSVIGAIIGIGGSLLLAASPVLATGSTLALVQDRFTVLGNQPIFEAVANAGFTVSGMSGGAGGNCSSGQPCRSNAGCVSNLCTLSVCQ